MQEDEGGVARHLGLIVDHPLSHVCILKEIVVIVPYMLSVPVSDFGFKNFDFFL